MPDNDEPEQPPTKHPKDMTSEEALDHLFHPEIAKAARKAAGKEVPADEPDEEE